jgi:hypothetical protein
VSAETLTFTALEALPLMTGRSSAGRGSSMGIITSGHIWGRRGQNRRVSPETPSRWSSASVPC